MMAQRMQNSVVSMTMVRSREINSKVHVMKSSPQPRFRHWLADINSELQNRTDPTQSKDLSHVSHSPFVLLSLGTRHEIVNTTEVLIKIDRNRSQCLWHMNVTKIMVPQNGRYFFYVFVCCHSWW